MNIPSSRVALTALMLGGLALAGCQSTSAELCENVCECAGGTGAEEACALESCEDQVDAFLDVAEDVGCEDEGDDFIECLVERFQCTEGVAEVDCQSAQEAAEQCMGVQIELGINPPSRTE